MKVLKITKLAVVVLFFAYLSATSSNAQNMDAANGQINTEYRGKIFLLRGFYSGNEIDFDENGKVAAGTGVGSWTLANVEIGAVEILPQAIEVKGERLGSWFTDGKTRMMKAGKIRIRIARRHVSTDDDLTTARKLLTPVFMHTDEDICPDLPEFWQLYCARTDPQASERVWEDILTRNHLAPYKNKATSATKSIVTAPVVVSSSEPRYTHAATKHGIEGHTVLKLIVDDTGRPGAVTIVRPVGMGLDEEAVQCVSQKWKFRPATHESKPVSVMINLEINFKCCP
ncbi:MAG: energy transducer TonB [Terriglobales bacterium]